MKVFAALARSLAKDYEVSTVFGLLGASTMMIADELVHRHGARCVRVAREDGAVLGAMGYQHSTGRLGVAAVGAGPALTNTFTSLVEAVRNHTPMLVLADDRFEAHGNVQGINQAAVVAPTGAGYVELQDPSTAVADLRHAIDLALSEQRPVVLDLPASIAMADIADASEDVVASTSPSRTPISGLDEALESIEGSSRPLLLAGWGAYLAHSRDELNALAEHLGAPVATTMKAKGFFTGSPFDLGTFGGFSSSTTKAIIGESDLILAFGAGLNEWTADHGALLEGKTIVQVDTRPDHMSMTYPATVEVIGDARDVAMALASRLEGVDGFPRGFRSDELQKRIDEHRPGSGEFATSRANGTVDLHDFMSRLEEIKPEGANVVTDGGRYVIAPMKHLTVEDPRHWLAPIGGFGSIGLALGASIGVSVARPDAPTILVVGDGAFMMSLYELHTAVRNSLDLIVVVMNDSAYSSEYHLYLASDSANAGLATSLTTFDWPEFAGLARSLGFEAVTLRSMDDFDTVSDAIQNRSRPLLVDVRLDPEALVGFHDASE